MKTGKPIAGGHNRVERLGSVRIPVAPRPWLEVAPAALPGVIFIATGLFAAEDTYLSILGFGICALLVVVGLVRRPRFPLWSLMATGVLLGPVSALFGISVGWIWCAVVALGIGICVWRRGSTPQGVWTTLGLMLAGGAFEAAVATIAEGVGFWRGLLRAMGPAGGVLVAVSVGCLFAKRQGLRATLLVIGAGYILVNWSLSSMRLAWGSDWAMTLSTVHTVLILVLCPVWVFRARSVRGQVAGLLMPNLLSWMIMLAAVSVLGGYGMTIKIGHVMTAVHCALGSALAVVLYAWIQASAKREPAEQA